MTRFSSLVALTLPALMLNVAPADACTSIVVGPKASMSGAVFCSYNADSYGMYGIMAHYPSSSHVRNAMREVVDWDSGVRHGQIPEAEQTYNVVGNVNEWQVAIAESTYGGREEMVDSTGVLDYGSLIYIALQRSKTAREAILVMTSLVETYGYCSEGETFSICDPNNAWIMELMGCGPGSKSVVWVAMRVPDDAICAHANQSRIGKFDLHSPNVVYSDNVISFARSKGWFAGRDEDFSWKDAYAKPDFEGRRFCDARVWSIYGRFADMSSFEPWALGLNPDAVDLPLWIVPNRKLDLSDVMDCMRDHYEGSPLAVGEGSSDLGDGIWQMPYRLSPLTFMLDGKEYFHERPVSTQQTAFSMVAELRSWLNRNIGGVVWFCNDDPNMVPYTPVYCSARKIPVCYNDPNANEVSFSPNSAFWFCNMVSNMVYARYSVLFPELLAARIEVEKAVLVKRDEMEDKLSRVHSNDVVLGVLETTAIDLADNLMMQRWRQLFERLVVRYNDMVVRPVDANGNLIRGRVDRPGYPLSYLRRMNLKEVPQ